MTIKSFNPGSAAGDAGLLPGASGLSFGAPGLSFGAPGLSSGAPELSSGAPGLSTKGNSNAKYIVVEGPIGVGKSSLARKLASTFNASLLLEQPAENPFLERFYDAPKQHALATQLFFLFQRVEQLALLQQKDTRALGLVADFMIEKDPLFARITLDDDEYCLYQQVFQNLQIQAPKPDLVIYLQAPPEILQERVNKRRIKYEMGMDKAYLHRLSEVYTDYFHRYAESALLMINAADINPVDNDAHYAALVRHIGTINAGKHYFNPLVEAF